MKLSAQHIQVAIETITYSLRVSNWHGSVSEEARINTRDTLQRLMADTELDVTLSQSNDQEPK